MPRGLYHVADAILVEVVLDAVDRDIGTNMCCFPLCVASEYTDVSKLRAWHLPYLAPVRKVSSLLSQEKDKELRRDSFISKGLEVALRSMQTDSVDVPTVLCRLYYL